MRVRTRFALFASFAFVARAGAQTLASGVTSTDGAVQVLFPAQPDVCGDGETFIRSARGRSQTYVGNSWYNRPCVSGRARVLATVVSGAVTRLSVFVGPVPSTAASTRTLTATAGDAAAWLGQLASRAEGRVASKAIQALMFADVPPPWRLLLSLARSSERPREVRQSAILNLGFGVTETLGLADVDDHASDDDEMRAQAVFVLSQQRKSESVPELIDLARNAKHPAARKAAIFWLGQSGDPRALDVFAELLGLK